MILKPILEYDSKTNHTSKIELDSERKGNKYFNKYEKFSVKNLSSICSLIFNHKKAIVFIRNKNIIIIIISDDEFTGPN